MHTCSCYARYVLLNVVAIVLSSVLLFGGTAKQRKNLVILPSTPLDARFLNLSMAPHQSPKMDDKTNLTKIIKIKPIVLVLNRYSPPAIVMFSTSTKPAVRFLNGNGNPSRSSQCLAWKTCGTFGLP